MKKVLHALGLAAAVFFAYTVYHALAPLAAAINAVSGS
jgi:uncharacterized membrane protein required for colicin V production